MNKAYLSLGSNIDPEKNITLALEYLNQDFKILEVSHTWKTKPVGINSADFLNTAVKLITSLDSIDLKDKFLCHIEEIMGRVRVEDKFAPRTIDIDIIIFNDSVVDKNLFQLDHLILPFSELVPDLRSPDTKCTLAEIARQVLRNTNAAKFKCLRPPFQ
jgi:2-amino-4-hydroxy-6-hydroxymethyldihydropteridine diphosphokinase